MNQLIYSTIFKRVAVFAVALVLWLRAGSAATVTVTVGNGDNSFSPSSVTILPGDTVQWIFNENGHTCTSGSAGMPNGLWDSGFLPNGAVFTHTFHSPGSFPYYCIPHWSC